MCEISPVAAFKSKRNTILIVSFQSFVERHVIVVFNCFLAVIFMIEVSSEHAFYLQMLF